jgi:hypothetical protein
MRLEAVGRADGKETLGIRRRMAVTRLRVESEVAYFRGYSRTGIKRDADKGSFQNVHCFILLVRS